MRLNTAQRVWLAGRFLKDVEQMLGRLTATMVNTIAAAYFLRFANSDTPEDAKGVTLSDAILASLYGSLIIDSIGYLLYGRWKALARPTIGDLRFSHEQGLRRDAVVSEIAFVTPLHNILAILLGALIIQGSFKDENGGVSNATVYIFTSIIGIYLIGLPTLYLYNSLANNLENFLSWMIGANSALIRRLQDGNGDPLLVELVADAQASNFITPALRLAWQLHRLPQDSLLPRHSATRRNYGAVASSEPVNDTNVTLMSGVHFRRIQIEIAQICEDKFSTKNEKVLKEAEKKSKECVVVPEEYTCCITSQVMDNPVFLTWFEDQENEDGYINIHKSGVFDLSTLARWNNRYSRTDGKFECPTTKRTYTVENIIPLPGLKNRIDAFIKRIQSAEQSQEMQPLAAPSSAKSPGPR